MNSAEILIKFKADTGDVDKKTNTLGSSMKGLTKSITVGNLAAKGIAKGFSIMGSHMDSAIKRVDTMNNFPKVMKNFGVSTDEAKKSMDRIDKSVRGLPTSLDSAVAGVQNIFMATKDLKKSENLFKAVNDATMIFAQGSQEATDRFIYAYKQALSAGKVSAQDFNQMNDAIPGLMDKVAESMGMTYGQMKEGLSNGKVSMEQFNSALQKLDKEGVGDMQSMEKGAKSATGGIQTAITNLNTAITRGLGNAIGYIDEALKKSGMGGLNDVISGIGDAIDSVFKSIAPMIPVVVQIAQVLIKIAPVLLGLIGIIALINTGMKIYTAIQTAMRVATLLGAAAQWVLNSAFLACPITWIVLGIMAIVAIFVILWKKCEGFRNFWIGLWAKIKEMFTAVINFIKENWKSILLFLINPFAGAFSYLYKHSTKFRNFINGVVNKIVGFFKAIPGKIKAIPGKIVNFFKNLPKNMLNVGLNIVKGIGKGITSGTTWIKNKIKEFTNNVKNSLKSFFGIHSPSKWAENVVGQNISKGIANGLKSKKINWKDIGKKLGEQLKNGMSEAVKDVKSVADSLKSNLSKIDFLSEDDKGNKTLTNLSNIKTQVVQFGKNISKLKGQIPSGLYQEILGMGREEGLEYTNQLLGLTSGELKNYVNTYNAIQKESQKISDAYYNEEVKKIKTQYTDKILGQLKTIEKNSKKLGKKATKGLINGMLSDIKSLDSASKSVANSIIKSIKKTLKIKSPSRIMYSLGEYTSMGFLEGITSMSEDIENQMQKTFSLSPSITGTATNHFSPNINVNVENNMTTDPLGQVVNKVKTFSGGAKNDYNYGR